MSSPKLSDATKLSGPIAWMTNNHVAANLLMVVLLVAGVLGVLTSKQEIFPEFTLDQVNVQVGYPGASPGEVEQAITYAIEEKVRGIDGVKRVSSTSMEGMGAVSVALLLDADPQQVLADVKNEIDRITTFPENAEAAVVSLASKRSQVVSLILSGDHELSDLHAVAEQARLALLLDPEITQVDVEGVPPLEISVEIGRNQLERFGLTLQQIALEIRNASLELPAGALESQSGEIRVRVSDRRTTGAQLGNIVLRGTSGGGLLHLKDVAKIVDGYEDTHQYSLFEGKPAVRLTAYRVGNETPLKVAAAVHEYAKKLRTEHPNIGIAVWKDDSKILRGRIDLLLNNAVMGLLMVLLILALFLDIRLAFWVSLGIPVSFLGAFVLLGTIDLSINMITLFAFIVTLGMVVDDAIVVGERTYFYRGQGHSPIRAAVLAAREMAKPITFAILTTVAAFGPMLFVPGVMGKIFKMIPLVVISVLLVSLLESFFILPAHLARLEESKKRLPRRGLVSVLLGIQGQVAKTLATFTQRIYRPMVAACMRHRYFSVAASVAILILTIGVVASGRVPFNFFPSIEGDIVTANVRLPYGVALARTEAVGKALEIALAQTRDHFGGDQAIAGIYTSVGQQPAPSGPGAGAAEVGSHLLQIEVALPSTEERSFTSDAFLSDWRKRVGKLPAVESLTFSAASGPSSGAAVAIQLLSSNENQLAAAAGDITSVLQSHKQLRNVKNGYVTGKPQIDFQLLDQARSLGVSTRQLAGQLRSAFFGAEAIREQRGRHELKVMVRLPEHERRTEHDLEQLRIRSEGGQFVPLGQLVKLQRSVAPTSIKREDGRRKVVVTGELARGVSSPRAVLEALTGNEFSRLRRQYPQLEIELVGQQREQAETFSALGRGYLLAILLMYGLLALPFRSYIQPLIIMAVIPFGFVGAVMGHALMGYGLSIMSMFGLVALSGVVVNDSLVLIDATNGARATGLSPFEAVIEGGASRLRPILLTSLTTFFGLVPMLAETSLQARFLIPMAISLAFGILVATLVVLLLVPALYLIVEDLRRLLHGSPAPAQTSALEKTA